MQGKDIKALQRTHVTLRILQVVKRWFLLAEPPPRSDFKLAISYFTCFVEA